MNRCFRVMLLSVSLLTIPETARALPFVASPPRTWREQAISCDVLVFGTLQRPRPRIGSEGAKDILVIKSVLKNHPVLAGRKKLVLPCVMEVKDPCRLPCMLLFCDAFKGKLDPYHGVLVGEASATYLKGLLARDIRDQTQVLRYCFGYLNHPDKQVADDAAEEFKGLTEKDLAETARHFSARKLRSWLQDPKTPEERLPLFSRLLGCAGSESDAELLRNLADRYAAKGWVPVEVLIAQARLDPPRGLALLRKYLRDKKRPTLVRYFAIMALDHVLSQSPELMSKKDLLTCLTPLLDENDLAGLVIDCLRHQQFWDQTPKLLALYQGRAKDAALVRRAIVRFALQCPRDKAKCFIREVSSKEPKAIEDAQRDLTWEE